MKKLILFMCLVCTFSHAYAWKPLFAGHRGSLRGVENTEEAFMNGINFYHYTGLEIDVKTTKDGELVCWHDDDLKRVGHDVSIPNSNFADIKDLVLTQTRDGVEYTATICTVDRFLEICKEHQIFPIIELKWATGINNNDMSRFATLYKLIEKHELVEESIILTSMKKSLEYVRTNYPKLTCQYLCYSLSTENLKWCTEWQIHPSIGVGGFDILDVKRCRKAGLNVGTWTVNSKDNYLKHGKLGAYMMTCDYLRPNDMPELDDIDWENVILPEDTTTAIRVESITLSSDRIEMLKDDTAYIDVAIFPENATNQKLTAKVRDNARQIAIKCEDKRVRIIPKTVVETVVTVYCDGLSAECSLVVSEDDTPVENVMSNSNAPYKTLEKGQLLIHHNDQTVSVLGQYVQ
jgi:glycerophosphoryl diester phosphodiesterase